MQPNSTLPPLSSDSIKSVLVYAHFTSPALVFLVFLAAIVAQSVLEAEKEEAQKAQNQLSGPEGKRLPRTDSPSTAKSSVPGKWAFSPARKNFFVLTSILLSLTFVGNAVVTTIHAITHRDEDWWCGVDYVVGGL